MGTKWSTINHCFVCGSATTGLKLLPRPYTSCTSSFASYSCHLRQDLHLTVMNYSMNGVCCCCNWNWIKLNDSKYGIIRAHCDRGTIHQSTGDWPNKSYTRDRIKSEINVGLFTFEMPTISGEFVSILNTSNRRQLIASPADPLVEIWFLQIMSSKGNQ